MKSFKQFQEDYARVINPVKPITDFIGAGIGAVELGKKGFSNIMQMARPRKDGSTNDRKNVRSDILDDLMKKQKEVENIRKNKEKEAKNKEKYTGRVDPTKGKTSKRTTFDKPVTVKPEGEFHTNEFQSDKSMTEDAMSTPTNNVGDGKIAGTVEAGDDPPVKKRKKKGKKKRYIYGGRGSRKMWMA